MSPQVSRTREEPRRRRVAIINNNHQREVPYYFSDRNETTSPFMPLMRSHRVAPTLSTGEGSANRYTRSASASSIPYRTALGSSGKMVAPTRTSDGILASENVLAWEQSLGTSRTVAPMPVLSKSKKSSRRTTPQPAMPTRLMPHSPAQLSQVKMANVAANPFKDDEDDSSIAWVPGRQADGPEMAAALAEADAHRARSELKQCQRLLDKQRVELQTLRGLRTVAVRAASDEAARRGRPWSGEDVLRYSALQKAAVDPPSKPFHSDEMKEVMAQAIVSTTKRVDLALDNASRARSESERAEVEAHVMLEQAFGSRVSGAGEVPAYEQAARMTTRSILAQSGRTASRLRSSLQRLEEEASNAQAVHASDVRSLSARMISQREAVCAILVEGLRSAEQDGEYSIAGLQAKLKVVEESKGKDDAEAAAALQQLQASVAETQQLLKDERIGRAMEYDRHTLNIRSLKAEVATLKGALEESQQKHKADVKFLCEELGAEEAARLGEAEQHQVAAAAAQARAEAAIRLAEARYAEAREQSYAAREELLKKLRDLERSKEVTEGRLVKELRSLEQRRQYEYEMLMSRNEALNQQVIALKANTSSGRQKLYWSALKASGSPEHGVSEADMTAIASSSGYGSGSGSGQPHRPSPPIQPPIGGSGYYQWQSASGGSGGSVGSPTTPSMKRGGIEIKGTGMDPEL